MHFDYNRADGQNEGGAAVAVAERILTKTHIYLTVRAEDAEPATSRAVTIYKAFITRLYENSVGVRGIRIDMEDPEERKDLPGAWKAVGTMRAEIPDDLQVLGADNSLDAWRAIVRSTWARVTREWERDLVRAESYIALTRRAIPGEEAAQESKADAPKKLIPITVHLQGQTHSIEVPDTDTLLDGCLDKGLPMKFQCKAGVCDECKVRVLKGMEFLPPPNEAEMNMLGEALIKQGYRLSCQVTIKGPVEIEQ